MYNTTMAEDKSGLMLAVKVSLFSNIVLFVIKAIALVIVNSLAIAADLGISLISLSVSVFLYYVMKISERPADHFHNYGYSKIENVAEAIEGIILIGLAIAMSFQGIMNIIRPGQVHAPFVGLVASIIGIGINFWGAEFILKLAGKYGSPALKAEGIHFRLEGFISLAISISFCLLLIANYGGFVRLAYYIDPLATIFVSIFIALPSFRILKEAFMKLLDASIEEASQMDVIKALAKHYHRYCSFKDLRTRTAGRKKFVDIFLVIPQTITLKQAHNVSRLLKHDISSSLVDSEVHIHIEPCEKNCAYERQNKKCPYMQQGV